jgi:hypothetical protein
MRRNVFIPVRSQRTLYRICNGEPGCVSAGSAFPGQSLVAAASTPGAHATGLAVANARTFSKVPPAALRSAKPPRRGFTHFAPASHKPKTSFTFTCTFC